MKIKNNRTTFVDVLVGLCATYFTLDDDFLLKPSLKDSQILHQFPYTNMRLGGLWRLALEPDIDESVSPLL